MFFMAQKVGFKKALVIAVSILVLAGIVFTKSRGGFIGLLSIGLGLVAVSQNRAKTALVMGVLLAGVLAYSGTEYVDRIASIGDGVMASRSSSDRYMGLVNGISMMVKRPLLGVGIGAYAEARRQYFNYYFYAHNLYGELFGELGLASFFWFYWVYGMFRKSKDLKKILNKKIDSQKFYYYLLSGVQIGLFSRLVIGNFSHCAFIWFWFLMAAIVVSIDQIAKKDGLYPKVETEVRA